MRIFLSDAGIASRAVAGLGFFEIHSSFVLFREGG